jgi:hypothetical protein
MALDELTVHDQVAEFRRMICLNPVVAEILDRMPVLELPDCWLAAGALVQTVWNVLSDRDAQTGILDYDLNYFDASDLSWRLRTGPSQRPWAPWAGSRARSFSG